MQTTRDSLTTYLTQARTAADSPALTSDAPEDDDWKSEFIQLIRVVHRLLTLSGQVGQRVSFSEGVGVNGKIQDITSLIEWLYAHLPELTTEMSGQRATNHLNRYQNQGWGYFANGSSFAVEFNNEVAFFIDDQRVYLNRHIRRAILEVEHAFRPQS